AVIRRTERGGGPGAAVYHGAPGELTWKKRPRMMRWAVGVFERNPVERHRVVAVGKSPEERLAISQSDAVRRVAECSRRSLQDLGVVGHRRRELVDEILANDRLSRSGGQRTLRRSQPCRFRDLPGHGDFLGHCRDAKPDIDGQRLTRPELEPLATLLG